MKVIKNILIIFWQNPQYTMPLLILLWGIYYFFYGPIININDGLGYDGYYYGNIAKNFYQVVFGNQLSFRYIPRIFPSFVVNSMLIILNLPKENFIIIKGFQLYNLILLLLCTNIWYKISKIYKFDLKSIWLGFVLCFVNFANAEMPFFYPVLTDTTAFLLGFYLLYFYLRDNLFGKIIIIIVGSFTWPSFIYFGILLIIFPINFKIDFNEFSSQPLKLQNKLLAIFISLPFFIVAIYYIRIYFFTGTLDEVNAQLIPSLLYISAVLNFLLLSYFFIIFLPNNIAFRKYFLLLKKVLINIKIKYFLICISLFVIIYSIQKYLSNNLIEGDTFGSTIDYISLYSCIKPFVYIVVSITYFGPCFIILFFYLKNFKLHLKNLGVGVYLSFIIAFIMLFQTETRKIINFSPFIILLTVLVDKDLNLQKNLFLLLTIFSFLLSKVYVSLLYGLIPDSNSFKLYCINTYLISNIAYYIQLPIIIFMMVCILFIVKKNSYKHTNG